MLRTGHRTVSPRSGSLLVHGVPRSLRKLLAIGILATAFAGCRGPSTMKTVFLGYAEVYAEISNQQLLLNLARRANGHPVYFLQMGPISSTFQFEAMGSGTVGHSRTHASGVAAMDQPGVADLMNFGGTLGGTVSEQPNFNFTPLSGETFASSFFRPVSPRIFFNLFSQGTRADQLFRVMVQSVAMTSGGETRIFENLIDPLRPNVYRNFLVLAWHARELQRRGLLRTSPDGTALMLDKTADKFLATLDQETGYRLEADAATTRPATTNEVAGLIFSMRTFEGILSAMASESEFFDSLGSSGDASVVQSIPPPERRPILRIRADSFSRETTLPVVRVHYRGEVYMIADEKVREGSGPSPRAERWNRDAFNLLSYLYAEIFFDPNKLPVQQLIQIQ